MNHPKKYLLSVIKDIAEFLWVNESSLGIQIQKLFKALALFMCINNHRVMKREWILHKAKINFSNYVWHGWRAPVKPWQTEDPAYSRIVNKNSLGIFKNCWKRCHSSCAQTIVENCNEKLFFLLCKRNWRFLLAFEKFFFLQKHQTLCLNVSHHYSKAAYIHMFQSLRKRPT